MSWRHVSDNGKQLQSRDVKKFLKEAGIKDRKTPPYIAQYNPVEQANQMMKMMGKQYIKTAQKTWDRYMLESTFTYNRTPSEAIGHSPTYLSNGRKLIV